MSLLAWLVALTALLAGGVTAAADGALLAADPDRSSDRRPDPRRASQRERRHRVLAIARITAHLVTGIAMAWALGLTPRSTGEALGISLILAMIVVIVGETAPRAVGDAIGEPVLRTLAPVLLPIELIFGPLVAVGIRFDRTLQRLLPPAEATEEDRETTAEQFRQVVQSEADVPADNRSILHNVFNLGDTEVQQVMVPRVDIVGIEKEAPWSELIDRVRSSAHARLPVYEETLDEVIGIVFAKDLLPAVIDDVEPTAGWTSLIRPALFIPESKPIDDQLREFKATGNHIAIVVDEYGGTAGLITIEDILEEIVGDIRDEYDREEPPIEREDGRRYWVSARVSLDDLSEALGHQFGRDDVTTVGGLIYHVLGRVPRSGEELTIDGFRVVVERVVRRRIERVYFERPGAVVGRPS
ncbi:MAG: hemolysin family protein [Gemmatimonadaceae bacterium]